MEAADGFRGSKNGPADPRLVKSDKCAVPLLNLYNTVLNRHSPPNNRGKCHRCKPGKLDLLRISIPVAFRRIVPYFRAHATASSVGDLHRRGVYWRRAPR